MRFSQASRNGSPHNPCLKWSVTHSMFELISVPTDELATATSTEN
jgi:hypothetical protein